MIDLKPCPFCGGVAKIYASTIGVSVKCVKCHAQTETYIDTCYELCEKANATERVIKAWNRRKSDDVVNISARDRL